MLKLRICMPYGFGGCSASGNEPTASGIGVTVALSPGVAAIGMALLR